MKFKNWHSLGVVSVVFMINLACFYPDVFGAIMVWISVAAIAGVCIFAIATMLDRLEKFAAKDDDD